MLLLQKMGESLVCCVKKKGPRLSFPDEKLTSSDA